MLVLSLLIDKPDVVSLLSVTDAVLCLDSSVPLTVLGLSVMDSFLLIEPDVAAPLFSDVIQHFDGFC